jgi:hypothetical protein
MSEKPGYIDGKHFTEYSDEVRRLRREGKSDEAVRLLLRLIDATEAESVDTGFGVAPWYYDQLSIEYKKRGQIDESRAVLHRFADQKHSPGRASVKLMEKLQKEIS